MGKKMKIPNNYKSINTINIIMISNNVDAIRNTTTFENIFSFNNNGVFVNYMRKNNTLFV